MALYPSTSTNNLLYLMHHEAPDPPLPTPPDDIGCYPTLQISNYSFPTQTKITDWTIHRPLIPNVPTGQSISSSAHPIQANQSFFQHLLPFGTLIPTIDPTKTLRICIQNTPHSFQLYGDNIEMSLLVFNIKSLGVSMFVPISLNINWCNKNNWSRTKFHFCKISSHIHLSTGCSDISLQQDYLKSSLVGGTAILTFGMWSSKVSSSSSDPSSFSSYSITTIQGPQNKSISFITAYIAINKGSNIGIDSLNAQQTTIHEKNKYFTLNHLLSKMLAPGRMPSGDTIKKLRNSNKPIMP
jgi:hypothetical protein